MSRALSGNRSVSAETRARVLAAAEQLHYKVDKNASGLRLKQSRTLALLFFEEGPGEGALLNPFYLSMLGPMVRSCAQHGYDLLISTQQLSSDWHVDYEDSRKADGIVLLGYGDYLAYRPRLEALVERGTHFVRWGAGSEAELGATIGSDNQQGGFDATHHLLRVRPPLDRLPRHRDLGLPGVPRPLARLLPGAQGSRDRARRPASGRCRPERGIGQRGACRAGRAGGRI